MPFNYEITSCLSPFSTNFFHSIATFLTYDFTVLLFNFFAVDSTSLEIVIKAKKEEI